uniref:Myelin basic protein n=1 Tax=Caenorhabditis tropicalis TaxID=1561998 RepID=A0A1I7TJT3_9PELO
MSWTAAGDSSSWVSSKIKDKGEKHKLKPQSVPTSPAASGRGESSLSPLDSALQGLRMKKPSTSKSSSPPGTPVAKDHRDSFRDSFKKTLFRSFSTSSDKRKPTTSLDIEQGHSSHGHGEHAENPAIRAVRQFKSAHESFRLRMFQEQHGFEPVVCA